MIAPTAVLAALTPVHRPRGRARSTRSASGRRRTCWIPRATSGRCWDDEPTDARGGPGGGVGAAVGLGQPRRTCSAVIAVAAVLFVVYPIDLPWWPNGSGPTAGVRGALRGTSSSTWCGSNVWLTIAVLGPQRSVRTELVRVELRVDDPRLIAMVTNLTALTPGAMVVRVDADGARRRCCWSTCSACATRTGSRRAMLGAGASLRACTRHRRAGRPAGAGGGATMIAVSFVALGIAAVCFARSSGPWAPAERPGDRAGRPGDRRRGRRGAARHVDRQRLVPAGAGGRDPGRVREHRRVGALHRGSGGP